jgi:thymidylate kinase
MSVAEMQTIVAAAAPPTSADPKGVLLARVLDVLDREGVPYCVMHGYANLPDVISGDVDMLVPHEAMPKRVAELLRSRQAQLGARVVQWFADRAHFIVLSMPGADGAPIFLQLHISTDYEIANRLIYDGNEVIRTRRRSERGLWVPAGHVEFICVLANRVYKGKLEDRHTKQLAHLWTNERDKCAHEIFRFFSSDSARMVADAAEVGDWAHVVRNLPAMRRELMRTSVMRQPGSYAARLLGAQARRVARWICPKSGLHVVFLGPDGVGKSTVIDAVQARVADAFLCVNYKTFAGSILPNKPKKSPHALPPRSKAASFAKAGWWLWCYTAGYMKATWPTLCRGGLAINHRYLVDAIVDPKRYRYSGPTELLSSIWQVVPKPDLIVFLDAPASIIWERKKETTLEETTRQCESYRAMAAKLPNARIVDTNQDVNKTIEQVTELILAMMAARMARRF